MKWDERLGNTDALRIGFVCSGNPKHLTMLLEV